MPKKTLPAWAKVGAKVLIRSSAYGARIPATAQRGVVVEITSAGLLWVRTLLDQKRWDERGRTDSPRAWTARYQVAESLDSPPDDLSRSTSAYEFDSMGGRRRQLRPDTPENRELWREEMRNFAARMVEQRRHERKALLARQEAEALRKRRLAALERFESVGKRKGMFTNRAGMTADNEAAEANRELIVFIRGVIGSGNHE